MFWYNDEEPPCPAVRLRITDHKRRLSFDIYDAVVDTGSNATCIPKQLADELRQARKVSYAPCTVEDEAGNEVPGEMIRVTTAFIEFLDRDDNVLLSEFHGDLKLVVRQEGILGRDVLNNRRTFFNGPKSRWLLGKRREGGNQP